MSSMKLALLKRLNASTIASTVTVRAILPRPERHHRPVVFALELEERVVHDGDDALRRDVVVRMVALLLLDAPRLRGAAPMTPIATSAARCRGRLRRQPPATPRPSP
jgi:hypothetical protein